MPLPVGRYRERSRYPLRHCGCRDHSCSDTKPGRRGCSPREIRGRRRASLFLKMFSSGPYLDTQNLADIPADNRGSTRIGVDVDLHQGWTGPSSCTTANERVYIAVRAIGESTNDAPG